jgi:hypothetical protein
VAAAACVALAVVAGALAGGANNVVIAQASQDEPTSVHFHLQVAPFGGDSADSSNIAIALSHDCTGCSSTAVAVQAIFLTGDPSTVTPANVAAATNANCESCTAYAYAWQYVVSTGGPVDLSPDGRQAVQAIRGEIADAAGSGLPPGALTARLDELTSQLKATIDASLVLAGGNPRGHSERHVDEHEG